MIDYGIGGISLWPLSEERLEAYREARNDYRVRRWCRQRHLIEEKQQREWYERQSKDPSIVMLEARLYLTHPVGVCGLTDIDPYNQRAEFSLYVYPSEQGQGYGSSILKTLVNYGFSDLNLNMIWGETVGENKAMKMFRDVGFVETGFRPSFYYKDGQFHDSHIFSMLRESWNILPSA